MTYPKEVKSLIKSLKLKNELVYDGLRQNHSEGDYWVQSYMLMGKRYWRVDWTPEGSKFMEVAKIIQA